MVAALVAEIPQDWWFAFQSQGASGGEWIGPFVESTLDGMPRRSEALVLRPIAFSATMSRFFTMWTFFFANMRPGLAFGWNGPSH